MRLDKSLVDRILERVRMGLRDASRDTIVDRLGKELMSDRQTVAQLLVFGVLDLPEKPEIEAAGDIDRVAAILAKAGAGAARIVDAAGERAFPFDGSEAPSENASADSEASGWLPGVILKILEITHSHDGMVTIGLLKEYDVAPISQLKRALRILVDRGDYEIHDKGKATYYTLARETQGDEEHE